MTDPSTHPGTVDALWVGPPAELPDKTQLVPHETVVRVPAGEAETSANWQPVKPAAPAPAPKAKPTTGGGE